MNRSPITDLTMKLKGLRGLKEQLTSYEKQMQMVKDYCCILEGLIENKMLRNTLDLKSFRENLEDNSRHVSPSRIMIFLFTEIFA